MKTVSWKKIQNQLIIENCLTFGHEAQFTQKKISKYLLGTRINTEIFKLYELRSLLLKIYPLIHNLFYNPRLDLELKTKNRRRMMSSFEQRKDFSQKLDLQIQPKSYLKKYSILFSKQKNLVPHILFATVTPAFGYIVESAAQTCNMPVHKNRWLSGSITAGISYISDKNGWKYLSDSTQNQVFEIITQTWGANKQETEQIREKIRSSGSLRWPSLLIIPDIANNEMVIREAKTVNLPIIGLVNSHCKIEIDYPIFAQDQTDQSIYFFCHFLAGLIAKEMVYFQHKQFTRQNQKSRVSETGVPKRLPIHKKRWTQKAKKKPQHPGAKKGSKGSAPRRKNNKTFFFENVKPIQKEKADQFFLQKNFPDMLSIFGYVQKQFHKEDNEKRSKNISKILKKKRHFFPWKKKKPKIHFNPDSQEFLPLFEIKKKFYKKTPIRFYNALRDIKFKFHEWRYYATRQKRLQISLIRYFLQKKHQRQVIPIHLLGKYFLFVKRWTWSKRAINIIHQEKKNKQTRFKKNNGWNFEEKKNVWRKLKFFLMIDNLTRLQKMQSEAKSDHHFQTSNNNFYWSTLEQWSQDAKWQNNQKLLEFYFLYDCHMSMTQDDVKEAINKRSPKTPKKSFSKKNQFDLWKNKKKPFYKKKAKQDKKKQSWHTWKTKN